MSSLVKEKKKEKKKGWLKILGLLNRKQWNVGHGFIEQANKFLGELSNQ